MSETSGSAQSVATTPGGYSIAMALSFVSATADEVVAEFEVGEQHLQPYGIVHGGVYCGAVETTCSVGAGLYSAAAGQSVVGVENHTSFLRAVRAGKLRVTAVPLSRGRRTQIWEASVRDAGQRLVATGRVRLLCLEADSQIAGETVALKG
ncbi:MAG TPA: PaaI family thioesterase [Polyangiaceae bacterium]